MPDPAPAHVLLSLEGHSTVVTGACSGLGLCMGEPHTPEGALVLFTSDASEHVNGVVLTLDGGHCLRGM